MMYSSLPCCCGPPPPLHVRVCARNSYAAELHRSSCLGSHTSVEGVGAPACAADQRWIFGGDGHGSNGSRGALQKSCAALVVAAALSDPDHCVARIAQQHRVFDRGPGGGRHLHCVVECKCTLYLDQLSLVLPPNSQQQDRLCIRGVMPA